VQHFIEARALEMVRRLRERGYHVVGDLEELLPTADPDAPEHVSLGVSETKLLDESVEALAQLAERLTGAIVENRELKRELALARSSAERTVPARLRDPARQLVRRLRAVSRRMQPGETPRSGA
jgi:hypothetical protein